MSDKDRLRRRMRAARAEQSPAAIALRSAEICMHIEADVRYAAATVIATYVAFGAEADPAVLMRAAHAAGKHVAIPRVEAAGALSMRLWTPDSSLVDGPLGLREPSDDSPIIAASELDLIVVPGLAFDRGGRRLGYGKGYYDRLLHAADRATRVGMAFGLQLVDRVPTEDHDLPMDCVATETELFACPPRAT